jgi:hypothetical protein
MPTKIEFSEELASATVLWRYIPFIDLVNILDFGRLRFSSIATLRQKNDLYEATLPQDFTEQYNQSPARDILDRIISPTPDTRQPRTENLEIAAVSVYACCFHCAEEESMVMWENYPHAQVVVKTSVNRLEKSFEEEKEILKLTKVRYGNTCAELGTVVSEITPVRQLICSKVKGYAHEKEVRLWSKPPHKNFTDGKQSAGDQKASRDSFLRNFASTWEAVVNGPNLIEAVVISPNAHPGSDEVIRRYLHKHGISEDKSIFSQLT